MRPQMFTRIECHLERREFLLCKNHNSGSFHSGLEEESLHAIRSHDYDGAIRLRLPLLAMMDDWPAFRSYLRVVVCGHWVTHLYRLVKQTEKFAGRIVPNPIYDVLSVARLSGTRPIPQDCSSNL